MDTQRQDLFEAVTTIVDEEGLSGVVRIDIDGDVAFEGAYGFSHRGLGIPPTMETQFALASGAKGFTALTVMTLIERGELSLDTTARSLLGTDLAMIDDGVTIEHLLAHRSGIGDYLDEELVENWDDYLMPVSVHQLATTEQYVVALEGHPMKDPPGHRFVYNNSGFVVLALVAERATGIAFHDLVDQRVCQPAKMHDTAFLRSDALPGRAAIGYLDGEGLRTNVFHLPVRGNGDGGIYSTVADIHRLWDASFAGDIVNSNTLAQMLQPHSSVPEDRMHYGLGLWLSEALDHVSLHGFDTGAGFVSVRSIAGTTTSTVLSNQSRGAWPVSQRIDEYLAHYRPQP